MKKKSKRCRPIPADIDKRFSKVAESCMYNNCVKECICIISDKSFM